jgi:hypothetical protein
MKTTIAEWTRQNEATKPGTGFFIADEAGFRAELEFLKSLGCPDTEHAEFIFEEVIDHDESAYRAKVIITPRMLAWLEDEELTTEWKNLKELAQSRC